MVPSYVAWDHRPERETDSFSSNDPKLMSVDRTHHGGKIGNSNLGKPHKVSSRAPDG